MGPGRRKMTFLTLTEPDMDAALPLSSADEDRIADLAREAVIDTYLHPEGLMGPQEQFDAAMQHVAGQTSRAPLPVPQHLPHDDGRYPWPKPKPEPRAWLVGLKPLWWTLGGLAAVILLDLAGVGVWELWSMWGHRG